MSFTHEREALSEAVLVRVSYNKPHPTTNHPVCGQRVDGVREPRQIKAEPTQTKKRPGIAVFSYSGAFGVRAREDSNPRPSDP